MKTKLLSVTIKHLIIWFVSLVMIAPLLLILLNSLKNKEQASTMDLTLPTSLHFENFLIVFEKGKIAVSLWNSVLYSGGATVLCVLLSAMAAYVFSRNRTRLNHLIYFYVILGIAMPLNYFTLMKMMQWTHLINTQIGIIILYAVIQIPFCVFILYGFISSVPKELDEAGIIDGCSPNRLFYSVIFPLLKPAIATVFILVFLNTWNEFLIPLYFLNETSHWPMTLSIYNFFGQFQMDWNLISANILLTSLPVIIVYLAGQRYIIAGMTSGSVKG